MRTLQFKSAADFRRWLQKNHAASDGIWLRLFKKNSGKKSVSRTEALDEALCFGWIDGRGKPCDEVCWLQKFTPRRSRSGWSKKNTEHVKRLIKAGVMAPAGLKAVEAAKADGRWAGAYASPRNAKPPEDFLRRLEKHPRAKAFFESLNKANVYSIVYRLQAARKPETREKRMNMILGMMQDGKKFHP
jgi:uncharacterized protein YdeI (YjbR/CyaY-like superfamily)